MKVTVEVFVFVYIQLAYFLDSTDILEQRIKRMKAGKVCVWEGVLLYEATWCVTEARAQFSAPAQSSK